MDEKLIVLAGATGNLGGRIARALLQRGAGVIALVRFGSAPGKVDELRTLGATIAEIDFSSLAALTSSCAGASCVLSALSGLREEIAPGKNRILYLLGHLTAVHDRMLPLLGVGARLHQELDQDFLTASDKAAPDRVSAASLREAWAKVNATLTSAIEALSAEEWLKKHEAVSMEDFAKEPLRNRLSVLLSRTAHVQFHTGQIRLAVKDLS